MQLRPSPWRQAVDLANMMLVLAVPNRRRPRVRTRPPLLHCGRDRGSLRGGTRRGQPHAIAHGDEEGRPRPARPVPRPRARAAPDLAATLEPDPRRARGPARPRRPRRRPAHLEPVDARARSRDRRQAELRHERRDDPHGANGAGGHVGAVPRDASCGLGPRRRRGRGRPGTVLARLGHRRDRAVEATLLPARRVRCRGRERGAE